MMLVTAVPLGFFADRVGRHRVAVAAAALIVISAVAHALSNDFWSLMAARVLFGLAFTGMLTAGIAWTVLSVAPKDRARAIGGVMPVAASSFLIGPYLAGRLTDVGGTTLAYTVIAVLSDLSLLWLALSPAGDRAKHEQPSPRELLGVIRSTVVLAAFILLFLGVLVDVMVNLLVPLQLDENGLSAGQIGAILSASGVLYLLSALIAVSKRGSHRQFARGRHSGLADRAQSCPVSGIVGNQHAGCGFDGTWRCSRYLLHRCVSSRRPRSDSSWRWARRRQRRAHGGVGASKCRGANRQRARGQRTRRQLDVCSSRGDMRSDRNLDADRRACSRVSQSGSSYLSGVAMTSATFTWKFASISPSGS